MRKFIAFAAALAVTSQMAAPVMAADMFPSSTMLGWKQQGSAAAMAYFRMPLRAGKHDARQPRLGLAITAPSTYNAGTVINHAAQPTLLDLNFSGRGFNSSWKSTFTINDTVAWTSDPKSLPKNTRTLMDSGISWVVVGVLSVGIGVGAYALADRDR